MNRIVLALALILVACGPKAAAPPLEGARIGGPFSLVDQNGQTVTDQTIAPGKYRIMYFGYTFCPDVCPTDVASLARALKSFPARDKVRLIFVSVDPARDHPARLREFAASFDAGMAALTGSPAAIEATAKAYGVAYSIAPGQARDAYLVDHSRVAYLMSPDNKPIALLPQEDTPQAIAAELAKWVK